MRVAERATAAGFAAAAPLIEPGRSERELQIELEAAFFRNGADSLAFDSIVGGGPNSAVLHFPPSARQVRRGRARADRRGRGVSGLRKRHHAHVSGVGRAGRSAGRAARAGAQAGLKAKDLCAPGVEWRDVHLGAAEVLAAGLVDQGLLRGDPAGLVEQGAVFVFFPHGIGHMLGLGVRDAGEILPGRPASEDDFPRLRMDLPLEAGFVVTIEPGIYFVPALIHGPEFRERHRAAVDWERAEELLDFGGIRIEDNVLVTEDGVEVLTGDVPLLADG